MGFSQSRGSCASECCLSAHCSRVSSPQSSHTCCETRKQRLQNSKIIAVHCAFAHHALHARKTTMHMQRNNFDANDSKAAWMNSDKALAMFAFDGRVMYKRCSVTCNTATTAVKCRGRRSCQCLYSCSSLFWGDCGGRQTQRERVKKSIFVADCSLILPEAKVGDHEMINTWNSYR